MSRDSSALVFFDDPSFDFAALEKVLRDAKLTVEVEGDAVGARIGDGPTLWCGINAEDHVILEAEEICMGTIHEAGISKCAARVEIYIEDLEEVLYEINTLIDVGSTIQEATNGYLFYTWNGSLTAPDAMGKNGPRSP